MKGRTLVACFGNPARGDDGFGALVYAALAPLLPDEVTRIHVRGAALDLLDLWHGYPHVILVDVVPSNEALGEPMVVDLSRASPDAVPLPGVARVVGAGSTHGLGVCGVVELARTLGELPTCVHLVIAFGREFGLGAPMSTELSARVQEVAALVARLVDPGPCTVGVP